MPRKRLLFAGLLALLLMSLLGACGKSNTVHTVSAPLTSNGAGMPLTSQIDGGPTGLLGVTSEADIGLTAADVNGRNAIYMAYVSGMSAAGGLPVPLPDPATNHIVIISTTTGNASDFGNGVALTDTTDLHLGVSICNFNNRLYVAFQGQEPGHPIHFGYFDGSTVLQGGTVIRDSNGVVQTTSSRPTMAVYNGRIYVAWRDTDPVGHIQMISSSDGFNFDEAITFTDTTGFNHESPTAPFITAMKFSDQPDERLYVAWKSSNSDNMYLGYYDAAQPSNSLQGKMSLSDTTQVGPALQSFGGQLWLGWAGTGFSLFNSLPLQVASAASDQQFVNNRQDPCNLSSVASAPGFADFNGHLYIAYDDANNSSDGNIDFCQIV